MQIRFWDKAGNNVTSMNLGLGSKVQLHAVIDGTDSEVPLSGDIYRNAAKIGTISWSPVTGSSEVWYAGLDVPIPVVDGDIIRAVITTPISISAQVVITRFKPALDGVTKSAQVVKIVGAGLAPGTKPKAVIPDAVGQILPFIENLGLKRNVRFAANVQLLRRYFNNTLELEGIQAFAYNTQADINNALATLKPPTFREIFDTWGRMNGDDWFPRGTTPTGDAGAWYWSDALGSAVQPNNTAKYTAFISDESPTTYDLEVTVTSTNNDDDFNTLCLAFYRDPATGLNHTLDFVIHRSGTVWVGSVAANQFVSVGFAAFTPNSATRFKYIRTATLPDDVIAKGWANAFKRIKATRRGNSFSVVASRWNSTVYDEASRMTFTLDDDPKLAVFKGGKPFGYGSLSQPVSYFKDVVIKTSLQRDIILDMRLNQVYQYRNNAWALVPGLTVNAIYGSPRTITSYDTGAQYHLNNDGSITAL